MKSDLDFTKVVPEDEFVAEDEEEKRLVRELLDQALAFVGSFTWCKRVSETYIGIAIGGVIGVVLVRIEPDRPDADEWLWVVVGDVPPAYLVADDAPNPASALAAYIGEMQAWIDAVKSGEPVDALIPVLTSGGAEPVRPARENAELLEARLRFLDEVILTEYAEDRPND